MLPVHSLTDPGQSRRIVPHKRPGRQRADASGPLRAVQCMLGSPVLSHVGSPRDAWLEAFVLGAQPRPLLPAQPPTVGRHTRTAITWLLPTEREAPKSGVRRGQRAMLWGRDGGRGGNLRGEEAGGHEHARAGGHSRAARRGHGVGAVGGRSESEAVDPVHHELRVDGLHGQHAPGHRRFSGHGTRRFFLLLWSLSSSGHAWINCGRCRPQVHCAEEVEDFQRIADALLINVGTLSSTWIDGMRAAAAAAQSLSKPWVLDPVGCGATSYRTQVRR